MYNKAPYQKYLILIFLTIKVSNAVQKNEKLKHIKWKQSSQIGNALSEKSQFRSFKFSQLQKNKENHSFAMAYTLTAQPNTSARRK